MIGEHEVAELLRAATDAIAVPGAPAQALAAAGNKRRRRRRVVASVATATTVIAVAVGVPVLMNSEFSGSSVVASAGPPTTSPDAACVDLVPSRLLPVWARAGFSDPKPRIPYVLGDNGDIAAILFAQPLTAPPSQDHNNKILWVSRVGAGSSLRITATLLGGSVTATRVIAGAPGPSIIDLPKPGCWHLRLEWGGSTDTLDLAYQAP